MSVGPISEGASPWSLTTVIVFLLLVVAWGFNYPFVNLGLESSGGLWLASARAGTGALVTVPLVSGLRGWGYLDRRGRRDALLIGIPNTAIFFGAWMWAARDVLPGIASVVIYTFPLWVALLSSPFLGHRLGARQWVSVGGGFLGVALISLVGVGGGTPISVPAILLLVVAAVSWAVGTVFFQRRFRRDEMVEANAYQLIGGTVALLAVTLVAAPLPLPHVTPLFVLAVFWLGVIGTAVAYAIWFSLLGRTRAVTLSAYVFLVPVVALAASAVIFSERLSAIQFVGVGLVLLSIYGIAHRSASPRLAARPSGP
ncbi:MAG: DMT family transporter [Thermoplasmata archaeon]